LSYDAFVFFTLFVYAGGVVHLGLVVVRLVP